MNDEKPDSQAEQQSTLYDLSDDPETIRKRDEILRQMGPLGRVCGTWYHSMEQVYLADRMARKGETWPLGNP